MYAIVEIAGQQFKVAKDQRVYVHRLQGEEGNKVSFDRVLFLEDGKDISIGAPAIDGAAVEAKIVKHLKGDKVIVFKKKRRKGYRKKNGHRQLLTELFIEGIIAKGAKKAGPSESGKKVETDAKKTAEAKKSPKKEAVKPVDKPKAEAAKTEASAKKAKVSTAKTEASTKKTKDSTAKTEPSAKKTKATPKTSPKKTADADLNKKTVAELKEMAKKKGIEGYSALRKAELIAVLKKN